MLIAISNNEKSMARRPTLMRKAAPAVTKIAAKDKANKTASNHPSSEKESFNAFPS